MKSKKTVKKVIQPLTFQEIIQKLNEFWSKAGCVVGQPYGLEVGAGTANPHTFFRALGPEPYNVAYVEPSRRPTDGRYGQNPNRLQHYYQYQVILKPAPENNIKLYIESLRAIGIDPEEHDLRFVEDNWQSAPLGAWGLGWEVWLDGMEVTQYTYFQQFAGIKLPLPCIEITYGLERLAMYIQDVTDYRQIKWNDTITYGDIFEKPEYWQSKYNFEDSNIEQLKSLYSIFEKSAQEQIDERKNYFSSYDNLLKLSHTFNLLDARGVISLNDRTSRFKKMGQLATKIGTAYLEERASMEYPFSKKQITLDSYEDKPQELAINHIKTDQPVYTLELGFEEIPAEYMAKWSNILTNNYLEDFLKETGLSYQKS